MGVLEQPPFSRHFGSVKAVDNVSFSIKQGEFFSLLGPSGCGKSTMLRMIAGLEDVNSGTISIDDAHLMLGAFANSNYNILENFWYGYIDEIRLWNTWLADSTISFHSKHPNKIGESYRYTENDIEIETHLDSLIGLWRFNFLEMVPLASKHN